MKDSVIQRKDSEEWLVQGRSVIVRRRLVSRKGRIGKKIARLGRMVSLRKEGIY